MGVYKGDNKSISIDVAPFECYMIIGLHPFAGGAMYMFATDLENNIKVVNDILGKEGITYNTEVGKIIFTCNTTMSYFVFLLSDFN